MNDLQNMLNLADDSERWLDRLADGELNADQQRQLLLALDAQPDSWRRCALAFIEAQTLRGELRSLTGPENSASDSGCTTIATGKLTSVLRPGGTLMFRLSWLALAASVLAAFTLGLAARGWWMGGSLSGQAGDLAGTQSPQSTAAATEKTLASVQNSFSGQAPSSDTANVADSTFTASAKWQALKVTIPTADGQGEQTVEVPLVAASKAEVQSLLAKQEPVLSDTALQTLESTGHEVEQHRAYYPVQLEDGTQAVLPMDFVEVRDTGNWQ